MKKNKIVFIIVGISIFLVIGLLEILVFSKPKNYPKVSKKNLYIVAPDKVKEKGLVEYTNDQLIDAHCLDGICIDGVTFYYTETGGRIEYSITNLSGTIASGYLKLVFDKQSLVAIYDNLQPNQTIKTSSFYVGTSIENKTDYKLERLTEKEIQKIK